MTNEALQYNTEQLLNSSFSFETVIMDLEQDPNNYELVKTLRLSHYEILFKLFKLTQQLPVAAPKRKARKVRVEEAAKEAAAEDE